MHSNDRMYVLCYTDQAGPEEQEKASVTSPLFCTRVRASVALLLFICIMYSHPSLSIDGTYFCGILFTMASPMVHSQPSRVQSPLIVSPIVMATSSRVQASLVGTPIGTPIAMANSSTAPPHEYLFTMAPPMAMVMATSSSVPNSQLKTPSLLQSIVSMVVEWIARLTYPILMLLFSSAHSKKTQALGGISCVFTVNFTHPIELVKTRMQVTGDSLGTTVSQVRVMFDGEQGPCT